MNTNLLNSNIMKTNNFFIKTILGLSLVASFTSCSNDDDTTLPDPVEEEEPITSLVLTFTNQDDSDDIITLTWEDANEDLEIDAGEQTVTGTFTSGEVYDAEIELFAEDENFLDEDILADQEAIDAHFFTYDDGTLDFTMVRSDDDEERTDGNKLGVFTEWTAGSTTGTGTITIKLYHESPNVTDDDGFGTAEGTDTDIDISFDVAVEASNAIISEELVEDVIEGILTELF